MSECFPFPPMSFFVPVCFKYSFFLFEHRLQTPDYRLSTIDYNLWVNLDPSCVGMTVIRMFSIFAEIIRYSCMSSKASLCSSAPLRLCVKHRVALSGIIAIIACSVGQAFSPLYLKRKTQIAINLFFVGNTFGFVNPTQEGSAGHRFVSQSIYFLLSGILLR